MTVVVIIAIVVTPAHLHDAGVCGSDGLHYAACGYKKAAASQLAAKSSRAFDGKLPFVSIRMFGLQLVEWPREVVSRIYKIGFRYFDSAQKNMENNKKFVAKLIDPFYF